MCSEREKVALARETKVLGENPSITNLTRAELLFTTSVNVRLSRHIFVIELSKIMCAKFEVFYFSIKAYKYTYNTLQSRYRE